MERERGQPAVKVYTRWDRCWRDRAERQPVVAYLHARDRKPRARKRRGAEDRRTRYTRYLIRHSKHDIFSRAGIHTGRKSRRGLSVYSGASLFAARASAAELKGAAREENKKERKGEGEGEGKEEKMVEQGRREGLSGSIGPRAIITAFNPVPLPSL